MMNDYSVTKYACARGLRAFEKDDARYGVATFVRVPWCEHPVRLDDRTDVDYLASELRDHAMRHVKEMATA
jgi:hypothetical protein